MKSYFDGSTATGSWQTLVGVAADESVWQGLEARWTETLKAHGAPYLHMAELVQLRNSFRGWGTYQRWELIEDLLALLQEYRDERRLRRFSCCVDLVALKAESRRRYVPRAERLCARILVRNVFTWYQAFPDRLLDAMELYFDRNERFQRHIDEDWRSGKSEAEFPELGLIRTIVDRDMRKTPALQVADMGAWAHNRAQAALGGTRIGELERWAFRITRATLAETAEVFDAARIQKAPFLEHGEGRRRLLRAKQASRR